MLVTSAADKGGRLVTLVGRAAFAPPRRGRYPAPRLGASFNVTSAAGAADVTRASLYPRTRNDSEIGGTHEHGNDSVSPTIGCTHKPTEPLETLAGVAVTRCLDCGAKVVRATCRGCGLPAVVFPTLADFHQHEYVCLESEL